MARYPSWLLMNTDCQTGANLKLACGRWNSFSVSVEGFQSAVSQPSGDY